MKKKYFISVLSLIIGIAFIINYTAFSQGEPCEGPMTSQEFQECSGCIPTWEDDTCQGKDGYLYSNAKEDENQGPG